MANACQLSSSRKEREREIFSSKLTTHESVPVVIQKKFNCLSNLNCNLDVNGAS